ncbi:MAG: 3'(2'),5'-bisphosphate nucleotidase CysQ, partial [Akkermansiaceae bacterium]
MIEVVKEIALEAGAAVLEVYGTEFGVETKEDSSPLTEADRRSNAVIERGLQNSFPEIPIISEEMKATEFAERKDWDQFWLVDPLDGTKEFVKRNGEFTVNIALIRKGQPVLGVVFQPVGEH